jgi:hypothetical protein
MIAAGLSAFSPWDTCSDATTAKATINAPLKFVVSNGLAPNAMTDGDEQD